MSEGWSYDRWLKSNHNEDDPDNCDCIDCTEQARDDYYASLDDE